MGQVVVKSEKRVTIDGQTFNSTESDTCDSAVKIKKQIPGAKTGTLSTRTNNTDGEITGQASHGIATGNRISIFWEVGGVKGSRYNVLVGTVAALAIPISGGSGDNLPAQASAVTIMKETAYDFRFDGDDMVAFAFYSGARGRVQLIDDNGDIAYTFVTNDVNQVDEWSRLSGLTNIVAGDIIVSAKLTHADTSTQEMRVSAGTLNS